jgi:TonB family protein
MKASEASLATVLGIAVLMSGCATAVCPPVVRHDVFFAISKRASGKLVGAFDSKKPDSGSYLAGVRQAIDMAWYYPERALQHGAKGRVGVEFTVSANGDLRDPRIVCSSGDLLLDRGVIVAIRSASPVKPIPSAIGKDQIPITATFEYVDNRAQGKPTHDSYLANLRHAINAQWVYPRLALLDGVQGKLTLELTILKDGHLEEIQIIRSSGIAMLDEEAIRAVNAAAPFEPISAEVGTESLKVLVDLRYEDDRPKKWPMPSLR